MAGLGLDPAAEQLVAALPEDIQNVIFQSFDPSGTKDGNVLGRLIGFARSVWSQRHLHLDGPAAREASAAIRAYPEDVQVRVISQFDASGTKDGNVLARLQRFAANVADRAAANGGVLPPARHAVASATSRAPAPRWQPLPVAAAPAYAPGAAVADFCARMGLHGAEAAFLQSLSEDIQEIVLRSFDPKGTKDGNVWGRLFGFVRSVWTQRLGLDAGAVAMLKGLQEEAQRVVITKFDPSRTKDGNIAARLESFARSVAGTTPAAAPRPAPAPRLRPQAQHEPWQAVPLSPWQAPRHHSWDQAPAWSPAPGKGQKAAPAAWRGAPSSPLDRFVAQWELNPEAASFLADLPERVSTAVFNGFDASGTKDGNVWGRLLGFVRSVWVKKCNLDKGVAEQMRKMPEESQMAIMVKFDPEQVAAGEDVLAHLQALAADGCAEQAPHGELAIVESGDQALAAFARDNGLDDEGWGFMEALQEDVRAVVISEFDAGGTKDGNVLARLQGFARCVENRRKRELERTGSFTGSRNVRPRY